MSPTRSDNESSHSTYRGCEAGGVWERLVRSCKRATFAVRNGRRLTEETLLTLCPSRAAPKARPLTAVSFDVNGLDALAPNHVLLGPSTGYFTVGLVQSNDHSHQRVFRQAQCYTELFWRRWLNKHVTSCKPGPCGFLIQRYLSQLTV